MKKEKVQSDRARVAGSMLDTQILRDHQLVLHNRDLLLALSYTARHHLTVSLSLSLYLLILHSQKIITKLLSSICLALT